MQILIPSEPDLLIKDDYLSFSPFSNDQRLIDRINRKLTDNGRIGFIHVFPKRQADIKQYILDEYIKLT